MQTYPDCFLRWRAYFFGERNYTVQFCTFPKTWMLYFAGYIFVLHFHGHTLSLTLLFAIGGLFTAVILNLFWSMDHNFFNISDGPLCLFAMLATHAQPIETVLHIGQRTFYQGFVELPADHRWSTRTTLRITGLRECFMITAWISVWSVRY